jgi:hypothetical protein
MTSTSGANCSIAARAARRESALRTSNPSESSASSTSTRKTDSSSTTRTLVLMGGLEEG